MRLREELGKFYGQHPGARDAVLVGHSMGGILSRAQVTSVDRGDWDAIGEKKASAMFARVKPGDLVHRATTFTANPNVDRAVFICTPHRGSEMAIGTCDTPECSDGVIEYWSSQMKSAASEKIVPGPHGACEMPETIEELNRILHLHLSRD